LSHIGRTLAHYQVVAPLGAGGMGEVFQARDTKLGRDVALKLLPDAFARDPERLARFEREAQVLASLNHPNIAAIYGLEEAGGVRFLVLELVPGETLADKVAGRGLPVDEALALCRDIAEAVEAAHERGIVHRDLKPANVKVRPDGSVKVLDFGLAKAFAGDSVTSDLTRSPTITSDGTRTGVVLGTAAYMSPEQARGKPLDRRTDIWSFGCVLYEALTGRQAFLGETVSDTIAAILRGEPDWTSLPEGTPPRLRELLARCLEKDPRRRLRDIGDARLEIEGIASGAFATPLAAATTAASASAGAPARRSAALPWAIAAVASLAALALAAILLSRGGHSPEPRRPLTTFSIAVPQATPLELTSRPAIALSPDGTRLVCVAGRDLNTRLYLRDMSRLEAVPMPGTEGGSGPFFSPDGEWVGFFAEGKLKKVSVQGGPPLTLCDAPDSRGACWGGDDEIILEPQFTGGLFRVPAAGGDPEPLTVPDTTQNERTHRWPEILPGGGAVLFTIGTEESPDNYDDARIAVLSLASGERKALPLTGSYTRYSPTGHLVYMRAGALLAVPFDLARLEVTGAPVPIFDHVQTDPTTGAANFAFSSIGSLAYLPGAYRNPERSLVWVDRSGAVEPITDVRRPYEAPCLSPDGQSIAVSIRLGPTGSSEDVWIYGIARKTLTRFTFNSGSLPTWSPDGTRLAYASSQDGPPNLFWKLADGSAGEERLNPAPLLEGPTSWSPDGRTLSFMRLDSTGTPDIWVLPLDGERVPKPLVRTEFDEWGGFISPDGRWIAYVSVETGRPEVYVRGFPEPRGKWQISSDGGEFALWSRDGRELFYLSGDKMMAVTISTSPSFRAAASTLLFEKHFYRAQLALRAYDVAPDGQRFLMVQEDETVSVATQINVVLEWFDELKRRVPPKKS
jgi:serine/threonine-protein kinase